MTLAPIFERELRLRARRPATYRLRLGVGLLGALICLAQLTFGSFFTNPAAAGREAFNSIVNAAFILSCAACLFTVGAINSERREGTLGLLFLTRVRGIDVLLGKLGSAGITGLCALAAFLPMLMIPVMAGGVTGGEACRKGLVLVNTLFLALAVGIHASAAYYEQFRVKAIAALTLVAIVLVMAIPMVVWAPNEVWPLMSPLSAMRAASDLAYRASARTYWISMALVQGTAWLFLAGASFWLRRNALFASRDENTPTATQRGVHRSPFIGTNEHPVEWLVYHQRGLRTALWTAALVSVAGRLTSMFFNWVRPGFGLFWIFSLSLPWLAVSLVSGGMFAWVACRFFFDARRTGELELLLTTPLSSAQIVDGQWRALKRLFFGPMVLMLAVSTAQGLFPFYYLWRLGPLPPGMDQGFVLYTLISCLMSLVYTVAALAAPCWLGLWFGLKSTTLAGAILRTVGLSQLVPYLLSMFGTIFLRTISFALFGSGAGFSIYYRASALLGQGLVLLYLVWIIFRARNRLYRELSKAEPVRFTLRWGTAGA